MRKMAVIAGAILAVSIAAQGVAEDLRVGMIGLDTSHVGAFTKVLNDPKHPEHVAGAKVVAAYKGGSPDVESSAKRVDEYTKQLQDEFGVKIYPTIEEMCEVVDAVMLESVDGRPHLEQVKPVFVAKKPVFIDKPLAGSLHDALEIARLGKEAGVPWFSASSYRYYPSMQKLLKENVGTIHSVISYGPCHLEPHHPDLFWYGVHATEALYTVMGTGCQSVVRTSTPGTDVVTGAWKDGRVGVFYGIREGSTPHKVTIFGEKAVAGQTEDSNSYAPLVAEVVKFFQTGKPPIAPETTLEIFAFMEAADESKRLGGVPVALADVIKKAQS